MMEKNGAINSCTPGGCKNGCQSKQASDTPRLKPQTRFPLDDEQANRIDNDLTKQAAEIVRDATKTSR